MGILMRLLKKFVCLARKKSGFTLVEATASVAVIGTLAAIALPIAIDKINQAKFAAADGDTKDIATAITNLIYDVGLNNLGDNTDFANTVHRQVFANTAGSLSAGDLPANSVQAGGQWASTVNATTGVGSLRNNLVINDLDETGIAGETGDYPRHLWKGPYIGANREFLDPWGKSYLVNIRAMRVGLALDNTTPIYGWILSAGPNQKLDTKDTDVLPGGDDRGVLLFRKSES